MMTHLASAARLWWTWMWPMLWQSGLFILIVWGIDRLIRRWAWPQVCYALWLLVLLKLVCPPWLASPTSLTAGLFSHKVPQLQTAYEPRPARMVIADSAPSITDDFTMPRPDPKPLPQAASPAPALTGPWWHVAGLLIWLSGFAGLSGVLVFRWRALRRAFLADSEASHTGALADLLAEIAGRLHLRRRPTLVFSERVASPAVFGPLRPILILPEEYRTRQDDPALRYILLHELAHIKRGDLLLHSTFIILQAIYWFNPLLWLARRRLQGLCELCCDATVAGILKEETPAYRETLLRTAAGLLGKRDEYSLGLLGLVERPGSLITRLRWLEKRIWHHGRLRLASVLIAVTIALLLIFPMAQPSPQAQARVQDLATNLTGKTSNPANAPISSITVDASQGRPAARFDGQEIELAGILTPQNGDWHPDGSPLDLSEFKLSEQDLSTITQWRRYREERKIALLFLSNNPLPEGAPSAMELLLGQGSPIAPVDTIHMQPTPNTTLRWPTLRVIEKIGPLPASLDLQTRLAYGALLPEQLEIDPRANGREYAFNGHTLIATVQNLPEHFSGDSMKPEERPQVTLAFRDGGLLPGFDVRVRLKDGRTLTPDDWPQKSYPRGTWGFGSWRPISQESVDRFIYCGRRTQTVLWRGILLQPSASSGFRKALLERTIQFPTDHSVGDLFIRNAGPAHEESGYNLMDWQQLEETRGTVTIPAGKSVRLNIHNGITDLSFLERLHPGDLQELAFSSSLNPKIPDKREKISLHESELAHLRGLTGLQLLNLSLVRVSSQGLKSLQDLQALEILYLTGPEFTDEGLKMLTGLSNLRVLSLDEISETGINTQWRGKLSAIYLGYIPDPKITDAGLASLTSRPSLEQLKLRGTGITDAGLPSLKRLPRLWDLDLSGTNVTDAGMADLKTLASLKYLYLDGTRITDAGLAQIAQMPWLERLLAGSNPRITDASLDSLKKLKKLDLLNLGQTAVTGQGMARIKPEMKASCYLWPKPETPPISSSSPQNGEALKTEMVRAYQAVGTYLINGKSMTVDKKTGKAIEQGSHYRFAFDRAHNSFRKDYTYQKDGEVQWVSACNGQTLWHRDLRPILSPGIRPGENLRDASLVMVTSVSQPLNFSSLVAKQPYLDSGLFPLLACLLGRDPIAELERTWPCPAGTLQIKQLAPRVDDPFKRPGLTITGWPQVPNKIPIRRVTYWLDPRTNLVSQWEWELVPTEGEDPATVNRGFEEIETGCLNQPLDPKLFTYDTKGLTVVHAYSELGESPRPDPKRLASALVQQSLPVQSTTVTSRPGNRTVRFPDKLSRGKIMLLDNDMIDRWVEHWVENSSYVYFHSGELSEARGEITVPSGKGLALYVARDHAEDLSWLDAFSPGDIQLLDLANLNTLKDQDLAHLGKLTGLKVLSLHGSKVSDAGLQYLLPLASLRFLMLNHTDITGRGLATLQGLKSLDALQIYNTMVDDGGLAALTGFPHLKHLRIGGRNISESGLGHLKGLGELESLWIQGWSITDQGMESLAALKNLRELDCATSGLTGPGLARLQTLSHLERLVLSGIGDAGVESLSRLPELKELSLSNGKGQFTLASIPAFKRMKTLKVLSLWSNGFDDALLAALHAALPACRIKDGNRDTDFPPPAWRQRFDAVYSLHQGEVLKRIPPPFIPERTQYLQSLPVPDTETNRPGGMIFNWTGSLHNTWKRLDGKSYRLEDYISIASDDGIADEAFSGPPDVMHIKVPAADWIVDMNASPAQRLAALEKLLATELGLHIRIEKKTVERDAIVVSGRLKVAAQSDRRIGTVVKITAGENETPVQKVNATLPDLVRLLGSKTQYPVVNNAEFSENDTFTLKSTIPRGTFDEGADQGKKDAVLKTILNNLAQQTSLQFKIERRPVARWEVSKQ